MDPQPQKERVDFIKLRRQQMEQGVSVNEPVQKINIQAVKLYSDQEVKDFRQKSDIYVKSDHKEVLAPIQDWSDYKFPSYITDELKRCQFDKPTAIQSQAIPIIMQGNDLIGVAQTGSGKTLAFLIPGIVHLKTQSRGNKADGPIMLVLAPTRELAMQIHQYVENFNLVSVCLFGGVEKKQQSYKLGRGVDVIVATTGRMIDFLDMERVRLDRTTYLVVDEADKMLDMGFEPQVRKIVGKMRSDRQTIFFSATWPREVQEMARDFCKKDSVQIQIGSTENTINKNIKQIITILENQDEKFDELIYVLDSLEKDNKVLIFAQTKRDCEDLCIKLNGEDFYALSLHGDKTQQERDYVMQELRSSRVQIVVATDVAQRGLDVRDITHVINYDFPTQIEDYIHRIGRTGRAGDSGEGISFIVQGEVDIRLIDQLIQLMKRAEQKIPEELFDYGAKRKSKNTRQKRPKKNGASGEQFVKKASSYQGGRSSYSSYNNEQSSSNFNNNGNKPFNDRSQQGERRPPTEHVFSRRAPEMVKQQSLPTNPQAAQSQPQSIVSQTQETPTPKVSRFFNSKK